MEKIREQVSNAQLEANVKLILEKVSQQMNDKDYVVKVDNEEVPHVEYLTLDLSKLTLTGKKKLAKRIHHTLKKNGMSTINKFFWYLKLHNIITQKVKMDYSDKEREIKHAKAVWKLIAKDAEAARVKYVETKGDFYKK